MKKRILILTLCSLVLLSGCGIHEKLADSVKQAAEQTIEKKAKTTPTPKVTATPAPKETHVSLKEKATMADWEFCVTKVSTKKVIKSGKYMGFKPKKGNVFIVVSLSVRNHGTKEDTAFPLVGYEDKMIQATLYTEKKKDYKPTQLLAYDKDLMTKKIKSKKQKKGTLTFEVPKKVGKSLKNLTLRLGTSKESIHYSLS